MRANVGVRNRIVGVVLVLLGMTLGIGTWPAQATAPSSLKGTQWTLVSYPSSSGNQTPGTTGASVATLNFRADGKTNGFTGCNTFNGTYLQWGSSLSLKLGPMTMQACVGPISVQEAAVMKYFPQVKTFTKGANLALKDAKGKTLLIYKAMATGLAGTSWQAAGVNNGKQAVVGDGNTAMVTATFSADGKLSGKGGCNNYATSYTLTGKTGIAIAPVASTMMMCQPDSLMATESQYFVALAKSITYVREGGRLTLRDANGAIQVTYVRQ